MEEESFIGAFGDVPTDLAGDYSQLFIFRTEDFGAWYRRVRDAYNREVGSLRDETYVDTMSDADLAEHGLVRIPVDADGMPIHVGDTVWGCISGMQMAVLELRLKDRWTISTDTGFIPKASAVTHVSPDSFERIADELERYANDSCGEDEIDGATASTLVDFADRIRRLAKREAEQ